MCIFHLNETCKTPELEKLSVSAKGLNLPVLMSQHIRPKYIFMYIRIYINLYVIYFQNYKYNDFYYKVFQYLHNNISLTQLRGKVVCNTDSSYCFSSAKDVQMNSSIVWSIIFIITVRRERFGSASVIFMNGSWHHTFKLILILEAPMVHHQIVCTRLNFHRIISLEHY